MNNENRALCLNRRAGDSVFVGDTEVKILAIRGKQVRIVFIAKPDVTIRRGEISKEEWEARHPWNANEDS